MNRFTWRVWKWYAAFAVSSIVLLLGAAYARSGEPDIRTAKPVPNISQTDDSADNTANRIIGRRGSEGLKPIDPPRGGSPDVPDFQIPRPHDVIIPGLRFVKWLVSTVVTLAIWTVVILAAIWIVRKIRGVQNNPRPSQRLLKALAKVRKRIEDRRAALKAELQDLEQGKVE